MNQILVTEKIYVTPELRRKKKMYKVKFFLSIFLVCILFSVYIYAEFDRNKNEEVSREILASLDLKSFGEGNEKDDTTIRIENNVLVVMLDEKQANREEMDITKLAKDTQNYIQSVEQYQNNQIEEVPEQAIYETDNGTKYKTNAIINIPTLEINYPVLKTDQDDLEDLLKISLVKFWGGEPNEVGNYVIVGHNYKNKKMFGKLSAIELNDIVELTDLTGRTLKYKVYDKYIVSPDDTACTSQKTNGKKEITLITCKTYGTQRLIVKAREVKE